MLVKRQFLLIYNHITLLGEFFEFVLLFHRLHAVELVDCKRPTKRSIDVIILVVNNLLEEDLPQWVDIPQGKTSDDIADRQMPQLLPVASAHLQQDVLVVELAGSAPPHQTGSSHTMRLYKLDLRVSLVGLPFHLWSDVSEMPCRWRRYFLRPLPIGHDRQHLSVPVDNLLDELAGEVHHDHEGNHTNTHHDDNFGVRDD